MILKANHKLGHVTCHMVKVFVAVPKSHTGWLRRNPVVRGRRQAVSVAIHGVAFVYTKKVRKGNSDPADLLAITQLPYAT